MIQIVEAYNKIRSIPYKIVDVQYTFDNSNELIHNKGASCTPKHIILDHLFKSLGLKTQVCVYEFKWSAFSPLLTKEINDLINPDQVDFHTNLSVHINDQWIIVDATWDDALIDAGFPGTKVWDGINSTKNSVTSISQYKFDSFEERNKFIKSRNNKIDNEAALVFALNSYFEKIRNNS